MSLLSVNHVLAHLGTENVAVVSQAMGLQRKILDQKHLTLNQNELQQSEEIKSIVPTWRSSTSQLEGLLTSMQIKSNAKLNIILASDLVRYLVLPAQPIYMNNREKLAYITASYREVYGDVVSNWEIKLQSAPAHQAAIAAAIDKDLLDTLNQLAVKHDLKLVSVNPYLMNVANSLAKQIGKVNGYLVIVEVKRLLLIHLSQGDCTNLRTFPINDDWQALLKTLMLRELMLGDTKYQDILVYAPMHRSSDINEIDGWKIKRIGTLKKPITHQQFAMLEAAL